MKVMVEKEVISNYQSAGQPFSMILILAEPVVGSFILSFYCWRLNICNGVPTEMCQISGALVRTPFKRIKVQSYYAKTGFSRGISPEIKHAVVQTVCFFEREQ